MSNLSLERFESTWSVLKKKSAKDKVTEAERQIEIQRNRDKHTQMLGMEDRRES